MTTDITHARRDGYLHVTLSGQSPGPAARDLLLRIRQLADEAGVTRLLVDGRGLSAPMSEMERYLVGELVAALFGPAYRAAVVYRADRINKFMEDVAVNRGANVLVVGDEDEALRWLLDPSVSG